MGVVTHDLLSGPTVFCCDVVLSMKNDVFLHRAGRDDVTTGKLFPGRGECLGLYRCVLIIFKRK